MFSLRLALRNLAHVASSLGSRNVRGAGYFSLLLVVSAVIFLRHPATNFVFDEQEALLANPFLNGSEPFWRAFSFDFWGLPPERTIGSYRPVVSLVWKALAPTLRLSTPYYFHLANLVTHAFVAREVAVFAEEARPRPPVAAIAGLTFAILAPSVEAVSGVVGLADLLVTLFSLRALRILARGHVTLLRGALLFAVTLAGFLSKETMIGATASLLLFALARVAGLRGKAVSVAALTLAYVASTVLRRSFFPAASLEVGHELSGSLGGAASAAMRFFAPPALPVDPLNNPLLGASLVERVSTALALFAESCRLFLWPLWPSGDYSYAETEVHGPSLGALVGGTLVAAFLGFGLSGYRAARDGDGARLLPRLGALWFVLAALPTANLFVLLPTVRADRLWYLPGVGFAWMFSTLVGRGLSSRGFPRFSALAGLGAVLTLHASVARVHANDYRDDLAFWRATSKTSTKSAKAHLNLGVMLGARGDREGRLRSTRRAVELAPLWPMGRIYLGDILCRMKRVDEAWPEYEKGLSLGPNQKSLVALALQCLWDQHAYEKHEERLSALADEHPGSWLAYLVAETTTRGEAEGGVPREHRPRGYNERGVSARKSQ